MVNLWIDRVSGQYVIGKPELLNYFSGKRFQLVGKVSDSNLSLGGIFDFNGVMYISKNTLRNISRNGKEIKKVNRYDIELTL